MTFVSKAGETFTGELISVDDKARVTVKRSDGEEFTFHASKFSEETLVEVSELWEQMEAKRIAAEEAAKAPQWKIAYFIAPRVKARLGKQDLDVEMTPDRLKQFTDAGARMARVMKDWSGGHARVQVDTIVLEEPLTDFSPVRGSFWPAPSDMEDVIGDVVKKGDYDSVVIGLDGTTFRASWAGLGITSMPDRNALGTTYAVVRNPGSETFVHEWLHGSSTYAREALGADVPDPHDNGKLGVSKENGGWKHWYTMLMSGTAPRDSVPSAGFTKEDWEKGGPYYKKRR